MMKILISIIFAIFMIQSCGDNNINNSDNLEEQVSESELEFNNNEIDFIYDDEDDNDSSDDNDSDQNLTSI